MRSTIRLHHDDAPDRRRASRRARTGAVALLAAAALAGVAVPPTLAAPPTLATPPTPAQAAAVGVPPGAAHGLPSPAVDLGREVVAPGDGGASGSGPTTPEGVLRQASSTTGGAAADAAHVDVVRTWQELRDVLAGRPGGTQTDARTSTVPRIVYVVGTIDPWLQPDGTRLTCHDVERQVTVPGTTTPFSMADYVAAFGPGVDPSGPLEQARVAAAALQAERTLQHVGSNVTLVGVGEDATVVGASLRIRDASNVIVRNLTLRDAYDCFPQWDANDAGGNWNSAYDNLSVWTSTSVWVDHSTFDDGDHPPASLDEVYGRPFEVHDGLLDVTHGSDLVTISYDHFDQHDKTDLIGSSDSRTQDRGQHRVTWHHNRWTDIGQRAPRVRFGDVHVYNNLYEQVRPELYAEGEFFQYYLGAGRESSIVAENNAFALLDGADPATVIAGWGGTQLRETGSLVNGSPVDLLAAYNATATAPLSPDVRWNPADAYAYTLDDTATVAATVRAQAGAGVLDSGTPVASAPPGIPVVRDDNGWDTGLRDGDYTVSADLWWGQNATVAKLYENGALVGAQWLTGTTPAPQHVAFPVTGRVNGSYEYVVELLNPYGETRSRPHTVVVRDAPPGRAQIQATQTGSDLVVTTTLWWGTNGDEYVLTLDGVEVGHQALVPATPARQTVRTTLSGIAPGTHVLVAELRNAAGSTATAPVTVRVR